MKVGSCRIDKNRKITDIQREYFSQGWIFKNTAINEQICKNAESYPIPSEWDSILSAIINVLYRVTQDKILPVCVPLRKRAQHRK